MKEETKLYYELLETYTAYTAETIPSEIYFRSVDENGNEVMDVKDFQLAGKRKNYNDLVDHWDTKGKKQAQAMRNSKRKKLYKLINRHFRKIYKGLE